MNEKDFVSGGKAEYPRGDLLTSYILARQNSDGAGAFRAGGAGKTVSHAK